MMMYFFVEVEVLIFGPKEGIDSRNTRILFSHSARQNPVFVNHSSRPRTKLRTERNLPRL